jgi:hypothetical protein
VKARSTSLPINRSFTSAAAEWTATSSNQARGLPGRSTWKGADELKHRHRSQYESAAAWKAARQENPECKLIPCPMKETGIQALGMQSAVCVLIAGKAGKSRLLEVQAWADKNS